MAKAVIFDIDGTLLDSVDLHAQAWVEAFRKFGFTVDFQEIRSQIGKGGDQILPNYLSESELKKTGKSLTEYRGRLFKDEFLVKVKPFPGVRELFQKLKQNGQKVAVASSARGDELKIFEKIAGIEDLVDEEASSADAKKSKPHPDIFEAALEKLGNTIARENIVVVGDSPYDAEAAKRAGLKSVGVLCGGFPEDDLRKAGCSEIFEGPTELLLKLDSSLLAPN